MQGMNAHLLALETSSSVCGVSVLSYTDTPQLHTLSHDAMGEHAERLLPMVDQLLAQAGLSRHQLCTIAFGQGPGGFTGLRVACGVAQGMAFGLGIPVIGVSSLLAAAVRAHQALDPACQGAGIHHVVVQDARMNEVYLAVYQSPVAGGQAWRTVQEPLLIDATQVGPWLKQVLPDWAITDQAPAYLSGDALVAYPALQQLDEGLPALRLGGHWRADAPSVAQVALVAWQRGETIEPDAAAPLYVRDKVAFTTRERQHGAGGNPRAPAFGMTLSPMRAEHLDAVAAIESKVQSFPWTRQNFADGLQAGYDAWVALQGSRVVGFCMTMMAPDVAHLLVIGVEPQFQSKGVGARLLSKCEDQARQHQLDTVVLEVRCSNQQATGFYRHHGYVVFTVRKDYYPAAHGAREHADVMKKVLREGGVRHE